MHVVLPALVLLAFRVEPRAVALTAPFALLPDLDSLIQPHREVLHNFVVVLVAPLVAYAIGKRLQASWTALVPPAMFFLASHILLDLSGVAFLWPLTSQGIVFEPSIVTTATDGWKIALRVRWGLEEVPVFTEGEAVSTVAFELVLMLVVLSALAWGRVRAGLGEIWMLFSRVVAASRTRRSR